MSKAFGEEAGGLFCNRGEKREVRGDLRKGGWRGLMEDYGTAEKEDRLTITAGYRGKESLDRRVRKKQL